MEAKKIDNDKAYLRIATEWGVCPIVNANKWAIIVRDRMIISDGYNGRLPVLKTAARTMKD
jgi:deoxycytidylate deaminase